LDWQTPLAIAIAIVAGAYVLWRWLRPFFTRPADCCSRSDEEGELLQIEDS
jgi:hypothetical protein